MSTAGAGGTTWIYTYDRGGNILNKAAHAYTTGEVTSTELQWPYTYGDSNWKDKLTGYKDRILSYDAIGNMKSNLREYSGDHYEWEAGRRLKELSGNGYSIEYKYNHNGIRTYKKWYPDWYPLTVNYTLRGKQITQMTVDYHDWDEIPQQDVLYFYYDAQDKPAQISFNGEVYTYVHNLQGDIVGILDSNGTLVVEYKYDAWGRVLRISGSMAETLGRRNPFRYRGYVYDEESGLYYLRSRYYDPELGRFLNADDNLGDIGNILSHSIYSYCRNSVVNRYDQNGRADKLAIFAGNLLNEVLDDVFVRKAVSSIAGYNDIIPDHNFEIISVKWKEGYSTEEANRHNDILETVISGIYDANSVLAGMAMPTNNFFKKVTEGFSGYIVGSVLSKKIQGYFNDLFEVRSGAYLSIKCRNTRRFKIFWVFEGVETYDYEWRIYGGGHEVWMQYMYSGWGYKMTPWYKVGEMTHSEFENALGG